MFIFRKSRITKVLLILNQMLSVLLILTPFKSKGKPFFYPSSLSKIENFKEIVHVSDPEHTFQLHPYRFKGGVLHLKHFAGSSEGLQASKIL